MNHQIFDNLFLFIHFFAMNHFKSKTIADCNERLQLALKSWKKQEYPSIRQTARQFNMNLATLHRRINRDLSIAKSRE